MIEKFLRAKHWQIFIVIFIVPYSLQFIAMTISKNDPDRMMFFSPFIMIIFFLGLFGWFWSIATGLIGKIPKGVKMKIRKFNIFLIIPMIYIGISFAIMFPLHILSMFGLIYSFYYVAKTFKTVELQREVTFSDFAGDFFLLLFFPIGVWIIQPKINLMTD